MGRHGTVRPPIREGDRRSGTIEWVIRLALLALALAALWTVFGDEIGQFLSK